MKSFSVILNKEFTKKTAGGVQKENTWKYALTHNKHKLQHIQYSNIGKKISEYKVCFQKLVSVFPLLILITVFTNACKQKGKVMGQDVEKL